MGFGLLFVGYMFFFSYPYMEGMLDIPPELLGLVVSWFGVKTLSEYECGWDVLKRYYLILLPSAAIKLGLQILSLLGILESASALWAYVFEAMMIVFNLLLLVAIYKIAEETEVMSIKAKAKRNIIIMMFYYALTIVFSLPFDFIKNTFTYLSVNYYFNLVLFLISYLWRFLNLALIFSCYMWICKEGDEAMPAPENKIFPKKEKEE